jgi:HSP20 family protein
MVEKSEVGLTAPDFWGQVFGPVRHFGRQVADFFAPSSEAASSEDAYEISVELPGVEEDEIHVEAHGRRLTIAGEKKTEREGKDKNYYFSERIYGSFKRTFSLPEDADPGAITAEHKNGLLKIVVPRTRPQKGAARKIEVRGS